MQVVVEGMRDVPPLSGGETMPGLGLSRCTCPSTPVQGILSAPEQAPICRAVYILLHQLRLVAVP